MGSITLNILRGDVVALRVASRHGDLWRMGISPPVVSYWMLIRRGDMKPLRWMINQMEVAIQRAFQHNDDQILTWSYRDLGGTSGAALLWRSTQAQILCAVQAHIRATAPTTSTCWGDYADGLSHIMRAIMCKVMVISAAEDFFESEGFYLIRKIITIAMVMMPDNAVKIISELGHSAVSDTMQKLYRSTCFRTVVTKNEPRLLQWLFYHPYLFDVWGHMVQISEFWHAGASDCIIKSIDRDSIYYKNEIVMRLRYWLNDKFCTVDVVKAAQDAEAAAALCTIVTSLCYKNFTRQRVEDLAPTAEIASAALKNLAPALSE